MAEDNKIIIITSCYNHEKYVAEAIESVLNQTYSYFDFYIVNDGSEDNSAAVIEKYLYDERLHFINLKKNTGAAGAFEILNNIVRKSDAKYIAGISTDDKWEAEKLEKQIAFLEEHDEFKACFTWDKIIYEESTSAWGLGEDYSNQKNRDRFRWFQYFCFNGNRLNAVSALILKDTYVELGGWDWRFRQLQDFGLWLKLCTKYPFYIMPERLTLYRRHDKNLSSANALNVTIRDFNEQYYLFRQLFTDMDELFFTKSFKNKMLYANANGKDELLAEKISMLLQQDKPYQIWKQIGMDMYYDNYDNKTVMRILEEKYSLDIKKFHKLAGRVGIFTQFLKLEDVDETNEYQVNQVSRMLDLIDNQGLSVEMLKSFYLHTLEEIRQIALTMESGRYIYQRIRDKIWSIQDEEEIKSVCVICGEDIDEENILEIKEKFDVPVEVTVCPKKESMFGKLKETIKEDFTIFDRKEHRIRTLFECGRCPQIVIFAGCLSADYEVEELLYSVTLYSKIYTTEKMEKMSVYRDVRIV